MASALPGETGNPEIASFHLNDACFFTKNTKHSLKYHIVIVEPPFTVEMIARVHHTGPRNHSILLFVTHNVTHTLYVNQVCHAVSRGVKDGSCPSSMAYKTGANFVGHTMYIGDAFPHLLELIPTDN